MSLNNLFLNKELSQIAKDKGFDEFCIGLYNEEGNLIGYDMDDMKGSKGNSFSKHTCSAPLYQQIVDWLDSKGVFVRDSHNKIDYDNPDEDDMEDRPKVQKWEYHITQIDEGKKFHFSHRKSGYGFKTKYEALSEGIIEAFKLLP